MPCRAGILLVERSGDARTQCRGSLRVRQLTQRPAQLLELLTQRLAFGTVLQMALHPERRHGIELGVKIGLHSQRFRALHVVFLRPARASVF